MAKNGPWPVEPAIWDDQKFILLSDGERLVFLLLLTCPERLSLPGLMRTSIATLSAALRRPSGAVEVDLGRLIEVEMVCYDPAYRVVRIPSAPKYSVPPNPNVLKSWFDVWRNFPESELKYDHIESLRWAIKPEQRAVLDTWEDTFGRVVAGKKQSRGELSWSGAPPPGPPSGKSSSTSPSASASASNGFGTVPGTVPEPFL